MEKAESESLFPPTPPFFYLSTTISIAILILCLFSFVILVGLLYGLLMYDQIKKDWAKTKCQSGLFVGGEKNVEECLQTNLREVVSKSTQSLTYGSSLLTLLYGQMAGDVNNIRGIMSNVRNAVGQITQDIFARLGTFTVPIQSIFVTIKDMLGKMQGVFTTTLFTAITFILTMKSILVTILTFVIIILIALAAMIVVMWIFPFSWAAAATFTAIFVSISVPLAIFVSTVSKVTNLPGLPSIPKTPAMNKNPHVCFHPQTQFLVYDKRRRKNENGNGNENENENETFQQHPQHLQKKEKEKNRDSSGRDSRNIPRTFGEHSPEDSQEDSMDLCYKLTQAIFLFFPSFVSWQKEKEKEKDKENQQQPQPQQLIQRCHRETEKHINKIIQEQQEQEEFQNEFLKYQPIHAIQIGDFLESPKLFSFSSSSFVNVDEKEEEEKKKINQVIATFQLLRLPNVALFQLGHTLVTGSHLVFSSQFNQWVPSSQHEDSYCLSPQPQTSILHCFNTSTGYIQNGEYTFSDWDEMLPNDFQLIDANQQIQLLDSSFVLARNVKLGDYLFYNKQCVVGIVTTSFLFYPNAPHFSYSVLPSFPIPILPPLSCPHSSSSSSSSICSFCLSESESESELESEYTPKEPQPQPQQQYPTPNKSFSFTKQELEESLAFHFYTMNL